MRPDIRGTGPPTGLTANKGELYCDDASGNLWINRNGATDWFNLSGQAGGSAITRINGSSGAAGPDITFHKLSANAPANSTTTLTTVMTTTGLGPGTWAFKYLVRYQAGATTTGVNFSVNHTGTVTSFVASSFFPSTGGAAATGIADQVASATANMVEGKAARAKDTGLGATLGVDTLNADMLMVIEGVMVVTVSGDLQLKHASEVAAPTQVMADTSLILQKIG